VHTAFHPLHPGEGPYSYWCALFTALLSNKYVSVEMGKATLPLRKLIVLDKRVTRIWKLYQSYRHRHGGVAGLSHLVARVYETVANGGFGNLRNRIRAYESRLVGSSSLSSLPDSHDILSLEEVEPATARFIEDIAVHAHIYYADLAPEVRHYLKNIPVPFKLYVTTDTEDKATFIKSSLDGMENVRALDIRVVQNRGRDIAPMLVELGETLSHHEVVLHLHTKRSPHNPDLRGWRRYLMQSLLGNSRLVAAILDRFASNEQLGILYPQIYYPVIPFMRIGGNAAGLRSILRRAGRDAEEVGKIDMSAFPAGFMFWFRGSAIEPFIRLKLILEDFDSEAGQDDSTLAHAIERIFPYLASIAGLRKQTYLPVRMHDPAHPGAVPLTELLSVLSTPSSGTRIIFDDLVVGGDNQYSRDLIDETIADGRTALRIYYSNRAWFVEWIAADDGMIYVEASTTNLFAILSKVVTDDIIVNALYQYPEINKVIRHIVNLARVTGSILDYKVHAYYAICPSQHLLDNEEQFCHVPQDIRACNNCLHNNRYVHWVSSKSKDIIQWREPFSQLLEVAKIITVFDSSSINIMKRAFHVDESKIRLTRRNQ
jgi:hypothetical protein